MKKLLITVAEYLKRIEARQVKLENLMQLRKTVLTFEETANYMGCSKSNLYKLTMVGAIPHYKPRGKMIYFDKSELDEWLLSNKGTTLKVVDDNTDSSEKFN